MTKFNNSIMDKNQDVPHTKHSVKVRPRRASLLRLGQFTHRLTASPLHQLTPPQSVRQAPPWAHTDYDGRSDRGDRLAADKHSEENGLAHPDPKWSRSARQKKGEVAGAPSSVEAHVHGVGHGHHGHHGCLVAGNVPRRARPSERSTQAARPPPPPMRDESVASCLKRRSDVKTANKTSRDNPLAFGYAPRTRPAQLVPAKARGKEEAVVQSIREGRVRTARQVRNEQLREIADKRNAGRAMAAKAKETRRREIFSSGRW